MTFPLVRALNEVFVMMVMFRRFFLFAFTLPVITFSLLCCAAHANAAEIEFVYPPSAGEAVKLSVKDFAGYFKKMGEKSVTEILCWVSGIDI